VSNGALEKLCEFRISGEANQVLHAIIRKTWGWGKKQDAIALSTLMEMTKLPKRSVRRALRKLEGMNAIIRVRNNAHSEAITYYINETYNEWQREVKTAQGSKLRTEGGSIVRTKEGSKLRTDECAIVRTSKDTLKDTLKNTSKDRRARTDSPHARLQVWIESEEGQSWLSEQVTIYGNEFVSHELLKAGQWVKDNPVKGNKKNWGRFLGYWFRRADESQRRKETPNPLIDVG